MEIKRIFTATDFSRSAEFAVRRAALLAKARGARLEMVHVVHLPPLAGVWRKLVERGELSADKIGSHAAERLAALAADLARRVGVTPVTRILSGKVAPTLADAAKEGSADLVVVGAHGEHLLLDLFVGSTALALLRLSGQPVLLVKQTPPFDYERIVIATDFSAAARTAANVAADLLPAGTLFLFHAYEAPYERQLYYAGSDDEVMDYYRRLGEAEAQKQMTEFAATLGQPERFARKVRHGYAPAMINQYAAELGADLLVLGVNRQPGIAALLGSVATHLVNESRNDLLLVPLTD